MAINVIINRLLLLVAIVTLSQNANSQGLGDKIDTSNYYGYYVKPIGVNKYGYVDHPLLPVKLKGDRLTTAWLGKIDVIPIMVAELKEAGYEIVFDNELIKITNEQYLVASIYCDREKFGILYLQGHFADPKLENRHVNLFKNEAKGYKYTQSMKTVSGDTEYIHLSYLPSNIFQLSEDAHWYQFTNSEDDNQKLITKNVAIDLLKKDIRAIIAKAPKPVKSTEKPFLFKQ